MSAVFAGLSFQFPFYSGNKLTADPGNLVYELTASTNFIILIITAIILAGSLIAIFMFKNRKAQFRTTIILLVLSIGNVVLYFLEMQKYLSGNIALTSVFAFLIPLFLFMAVRGIRQDQKLIRSMDRLR